MVKDLVLKASTKFKPSSCVEIAIKSVEVHKCIVSYSMYTIPKQYKDAGDQLGPATVDFQMKITSHLV